jgi:hypothetical protein
MKTHDWYFSLRCWNRDLFMNYMSLSCFITWRLQKNNSWKNVSLVICILWILLMHCSLILHWWRRLWSRLLSIKNHGAIIMLDHDTYIIYGKKIGYYNYIWSHLVENNRLICIHIIFCAVTYYQARYVRIFYNQ